MHVTLQKYTRSASQWADAVCVRGIAKKRDGWDGDEWLRVYVSDYINQTHTWASLLFSI